MDAFSDTPKLRPISKKTGAQTTQGDGASSNSSTNNRAEYTQNFLEIWAGKQNNYNSGFNIHTFNNSYHFRNIPPLIYPRGQFNYIRPEISNDYRHRPQPQPLFDNYQWRRQNTNQVNNSQKHRPALFEDSKNKNDQSEKKKYSSSTEKTWSKTRDYSQTSNRTQRTDKDYGQRYDNHISRKYQKNPSPKRTFGDTSESKKLNKEDFKERYVRNYETGKNKHSSYKNKHNKEENKDKSKTPDPKASEKAVEQKKQESTQKVQPEKANAFEENYHKINKPNLDRERPYKETVKNKHSSYKNKYNKEENKDKLKTPDPKASEKAVEQKNQESTHKLQPKRANDFEENNNKINKLNPDRETPNKETGINKHSSYKNKYTKEENKNKSKTPDPKEPEKAVEQKNQESTQKVQPEKANDFEENYHKINKPNPDRETPDNDEDKVQNVNSIVLDNNTEDDPSSISRKENDENIQTDLFPVECTVETEKSKCLNSKDFNKSEKSKRHTKFSRYSKKSAETNIITKKTKNKQPYEKAKSSKSKIIQDSEEEFLQTEKAIDHTTLFDLAKVIENTSIFSHSRDETIVEDDCEKVKITENNEISERIDNNIIEQVCSSSDSRTNKDIVINNQVVNEYPEEYSSVNSSSELPKEAENIAEELPKEENEIQIQSTNTGARCIKLVPLEKLLDPNRCDSTSTRLNSESNDSNKNSEDEQTMNHILALPVAKIKKIINEKSRFDDFFKSQAIKRSLLKSQSLENKSILYEIFQPADTTETIETAIDVNPDTIHPTEENSSEDIENTMLCNSIFVIDSSSSSESCASDADSDACADRRHELQKSVAEGHVVSSFEQLILPNIRQGLQVSYKTKFSNSINNKLHFISCICTSEYNTKQFSKYEIAKIQRNIHFKDNSLALDFLKRQIENIFNNLDNPIWKTKKVKKENETEKLTTEIECMPTINVLDNKSVDGAEKVNVNDVNDNNKTQMQSTHTENQNETSNVLEPAVEKNTTTTTSSNELIYNEVLGLDVPEKENLTVETETETVDQSTREEDESRNELQEGTLPDKLQERCRQIVHQNNNNNNNNMVVDNLFASIHEIDMKLLDLRNKGLIIDDMITKFQKEKIEISLLAAELEKQKYMLLNAVLTSKMNEKIDKNVINNVNVSFNDTTKKRKRKVNIKNGNITKKARFQVKKAVENKNPKSTPTPMRENESNETQLPEPTLEVAKKNACEKKTEESVTTDMCLMKVSEQQVTDSVTDYSDLNSGLLEKFKGIVVSTICVEGYMLLAGAENGDLIGYDLKEQTLKNKYRKHSISITHIRFFPKDQLIYTIGLDGYFKITSLNNFQIDIQSVHIGEPLQTVDFEWDTAYIGSRWGNIYTYDLTTSKINVTPLCSTKISITVVKALKDDCGRKIIIVAGRGSEISYRDARSGTVLRTIQLPQYIFISNMILDKGLIYCSTQKKEFFKFNLATGTHLSTMLCGNGAACITLYKNRYLLVGSHDGFIYVMDKETNKVVINIATGRMILAMVVLGDKIITSSKNKGLQILDIPKHIVVKAMESMSS